MSLVNYSTREITCKIVYYGPGRSGKTTNLHYIYGQVPGDRKGTGTTQPTTRTQTGTSSGAITISNVTPADPAIPAEPPQIVVTGNGVKNVTLDLRPPSPRFVPLVRELLAGCDFNQAPN